ncbi:MAG: metal-dependent transcriptional regulator [Bacteroidia bacterium]|jgi:DtxR family Mn-dependent transcriptional regulator|nr:metal-dependent transcriptional regulator [Bacteroidia bacterium]MCC6768361.1 metal-dependent transcriptional regulator [Bacteroidia bacterium]
MNSLAEENYLKTLYNLANERGEVNVNELSKHLGIKMPTVTSMMKKLSEKGLVNYESYKPLRLTKAGESAAGKIIRKHRLTEMYLVQVMGFGWDEVHQIAEQIEHIHAPAFFSRMDEMLGYPKIDPHGSPIPDREGNIEKIHFSKLSECQPGDKLRLCAVVNSTDDFLRFLSRKGISLGLVMTVEAKEAFDGSMTLKFAEEKVAVLTQLATEWLLGERQNG